MITKMTKYSFILLSEETEGFLKKISDLGVVDITRSHKPVDAGSAAMLEESSVVKKAMNILKNTDYSNDADFEDISKAASECSGSGNPVKETLAVTGRLDELKAELAAADREQKLRRPWEEFDAEAIKGLSDKGYKVRFYCVSRKKFSSEWEQLYPLQIVNEDDNKIWFVTVSAIDEDYSFPVEEIAAPAGDWREIQNRLDSIRAEIIECKGKMLKLKESIADIEKHYETILSELDLYLAKSSDDKAVEDMISVFTGFAPVENDAVLTKAFDEMDVFYTKEEAKKDDNPPIKLKNNWFTRQFEVLTGMYGMPVYDEFDPTPILAPFYLLFFAMCMGDAGYGLILILFGIAVNKKWIKIDMFKNIGTLISTLGAGTLIVGLVLGTAFGMNLYEAAWVPDWLKSIMITDKGYDGKPQWIEGFSNQMVLAIGIGVFHICLAMIVKSIGYTKRFGFGKTVSTWGWTILIVGGIILAVLGMMSVMSPEVIKWCVIILAAVSALGIFIFNTPGRNPLINIGSGLWDTYNMATGLLGDVLSYIRLYALGLAGGMLGGVFNDLGLMVAANGWLFWIFALLILVFGHILNMAMACLGAFVHPLRLSFVEYFKNSGYEGKGMEYKPLK